MALADFLLNLRTAAMFVAPKVDFDNPRLNTDYMRETIGKADIWLTPRAVDGFDPDDFAFLPPDEREALRADVEAFREVAIRVPGNKPATEDQVRRASGPFLALLSRLRSYLDSGWRKAYLALSSVPFPHDVVGFVPEVAPDYTGEPAVWVWVTLEDEVFASPDRHQRIDRIEDQVKEALRAANITNQLYFGVRGRSEMAEVIGSDAGD